MKLTLFILLTKDKPDTIKLNRLAASLGILLGETFLVRTITQINNAPKPDDAYIVLYDNEFLSTNLALALPVHLQAGNFNAMVLFKRQGENVIAGVSKCPRVFKNDIILRLDCLVPEKSIKATQTIVDGYIYETL